MLNKLLTLASTINIKHTHICDVMLKNIETIQTTVTSYMPGYMSTLYTYNTFSLLTRPFEKPCTIHQQEPVFIDKCRPEGEAIEHIYRNKPHITSILGEKLAALHKTLINLKQLYMLTIGVGIILCEDNTIIPLLSINYDVLKPHLSPTHMTIRMNTINNIQFITDCKHLCISIDNYEEQYRGTVKAMATLIDVTQQLLNTITSHNQLRKTEYIGAYMWTDIKNHAISINTKIELYNTHMKEHELTIGANHTLEHHIDDQTIVSNYEYWVGLQRAKYVPILLPHYINRTKPSTRINDTNKIIIPNTWQDLLHPLITPHIIEYMITTTKHLHRLIQDSIDTS